MNIENLWISFLEKIKSQVSKLTYDTWFSKTKLVSIEAETAKVIVPMYLHKRHLLENYMDLIESTFNEVTGTNFIFEFVLEEEVLDLGNKEEAAGIQNKKLSDTNLKPTYIFENFVVGESNRFAHAASLAVAENPGKMYNPLFIYGSSGTGKTHLMQAIGNYIFKNTNKSVLYVTSDQFISDYLNITRKIGNESNFESIEFFKNKYRNVDVLIIDDIQFLANATQTQNEFFHTFQKLYEENKQIIISSDRSPDDLKILESRLTTRFNGGLTANIYPPELQLRKDIIRNKIEFQNLARPINEDVIDLIANNCDNDIRQLEGAVKRIYAYATMFNIPTITVQVANEAIKDFVTKGIASKNDIQRIQTVVCDYYRIKIEDLKGKKRTNIVTYPRQVAMYLSRILTDETYPRIGVEFGGRDHTTVIHAYEKIACEITKNEELVKIINKLKNNLK